MLFIQQTKQFPRLHVGFCYHWEVPQVCNLKFIRSQIQPQPVTSSPFPVQPSQLLPPVETASLLLSFSSNQTASLTSLTPNLGATLLQGAHFLILSLNSPCPPPWTTCSFHIPEQVKCTHLLAPLQLSVCQAAAVETRTMQTGPESDLQFLVSAHPKNILVREASGQPPSPVRLSEFLPPSQTPSSSPSGPFLSKCPHLFLHGKKKNRGH